MHPPFLETGAIIDPVCVAAYLANHLLDFRLRCLDRHAANSLQFLNGLFDELQYPYPFGCFARIQESQLIVKVTDRILEDLATVRLNVESGVVANCLHCLFKHFVRGCGQVAHADCVAIAARAKVKHLGNDLLGSTDDAILHVQIRGRRVVHVAVCDKQSDVVWECGRVRGTHSSAVRFAVAIEFGHSKGGTQAVEILSEQMGAHILDKVDSERLFAVWHIDLPVVEVHAATGLRPHEMEGLRDLVHVLYWVQIIALRCSEPRALLGQRTLV
mmetsp:Transcript_51212/g.132948  ORF Transcript_51212/g.132948 Transcript_51212/m.132948 type:complete len:272 (-) Transcript_51212:966-1781(-)